MEYKLEEFEQKFSKAKTLNDKAQGALAADKVDRNLLGKLWDKLVDTPAEKSAKVAQEGFDKATADATDAVAWWLNETIVDRMKRSGDYDTWSNTGITRAKKEAILDEVNKYLDFGKRIDRKIDVAIVSCKEAWIKEMADALTTSKAVAAASAAATRRAKADVNWVVQAMNNMATYMAPEGQAGKPMKERMAGTGADFVLDMIGTLDILSPFNMASISGGEQFCKDQKVKLAPILKALEQVRGIIEQNMEQEQAVMFGIEDEYMPKASTQVPETLQPMIKPDHHIAYRAFVEPQTLGVRVDKAFIQQVLADSSVLEKVARDEGPAPS